MNSSSMDTKIVEPMFHGNVNYYSEGITIIMTNNI